MQVSVEAGEGLERRMRIELPPEEVKSEVERRLQELARHASAPGFRPGKVPIKILRQRYGEQLQREVFSDLIQQSLSRAFEQTALRPASRPQIETDLDLAAGRACYTATFEVLPEFELAPLSDKVIKRPVCSVTDEDVEDMVWQLREASKTWEPVERPSQRGDRLTLDSVATLEDRPFPAGSGEGLTIWLGKTKLIPGLEEHLVGVKAGERHSIDLNLPADYSDPSLAGKPVHFEIEIKEVAEPRIPELDADFVKGFGFEDGDIEAFRADVRRNMEREMEERLRARLSEQVMDLLYESNPIELPRSMVEKEMRSMAEEMRQALGKEGARRLSVTPELFESTARRRVALLLIIGKIISEHQIKPDPARVRAMLERLAASYEDPQAVINYYYADARRLQPFESLALEEQVVEFVLSQVQIEDEHLSFTELVGRETDEDEDETD